MTSKKDYLSALEQAKSVIYYLRPDQMNLPTPDTEWKVRDLFRHMLYELMWVPDIVMGYTIEQIGDRYEGDIIGDNAVTAWRTASIRAREAVRRCELEDVAHLSYGDRTVREYLQEASVDLMVHLWDLGQALGIPVVFEHDIAERMYQQTLERTEELQASGLFAPPVAVAPNASIQTKLLGLLGRTAPTA